jgi:hypothetical protein
LSLPKTPIITPKKKPTVQPEDAFEDTALNWGLKSSKF